MSRNGKNELLLKRHRSLDEIIVQIDAVSKKSVDEMTKAIFTDNYSVTLISPDGEFPNALS
jgi:predicted Zn-dependent peptidase